MKKWSKYDLLHRASIETADKSSRDHQQISTPQPLAIIFPCFSEKTHRWGTLSAVPLYRRVIHARTHQYIYHLSWILVDYVDIVSVKRKSQIFFRLLDIKLCDLPTTGEVSASFLQSSALHSVKSILNNILAVTAESFLSRN